MSTPCPRHEAGSQTMSRTSTPGSAAQQAVADCAGNVQLLEARLCEVTQSMRALSKSNQVLRQALQEDAPGDADFQQAVEENYGALSRQGQTAVALVQALQAQGARIDLEPDIQQIILQLPQDYARSVNASATSGTSTQTDSGEAGGGLYL